MRSFESAAAVSRPSRVSSGPYGAGLSRVALRIAPVGLDPLARSLWHQRGRDQDAVVTQSTDLTVKPIPRRARFIAEIKLLVAAGQLSEHSFNRRRRAIDLAQISNFTIAARIGYRQCVLVLRCVRNRGFKHAILPQIYLQSG